LVASVILSFLVPKGYWKREKTMQMIFKEASSYTYSFLVVLPMFFSVMIISSVARKSNSPIWKNLFWGSLFTFFSFAFVLLYKIRMWLAIAPVLPAAIIITFFLCHKRFQNKNSPNKTEAGVKNE